MAKKVLLLVAWCCCYVLGILGAPAPVNVPGLGEIKVSSGHRPTIIKGIPTLVKLEQPLNLGIIAQVFEVLSDGRYLFRYELTDGTIRFEVGYTNYLNEVPYTVAEGFYIYNSFGGTVVKVAYVSDISGFRILEVGQIDKSEVEPSAQDLINKGKEDLHVVRL